MPNQTLPSPAGPPVTAGFGRLRAALLLVWGVASFGMVFFARDLQAVVAGWPFNFWFSAQGAVLVFIAILACYAWIRNRQGGDPASVMADGAVYRDYKRRLHRILATYVACFLVFLLVMALAEKAGLSKAWIGAVFLLATVLFYAAIGIYCRTADADEYYVAGRHVPAMYNGMATAADWMSAASFISLAGGLYLQGFSGTETQPGGLAYILGWTGGFCLVGLLIAPHLRKLELYTVPDYFRVRFGGRWPRLIAAFAAVLCSFTYVVAQIYGVGLITSRLTGVQFEIGILLGLGGVLVCSFLGGMRAVTWTQVSQYVILMLAFLIPVSWLAYKQLGNPLAPLVYGQQLEKITALEHQLARSPAERAVMAEYARRARVYELKLQDVQASLTREREALHARLQLLHDQKTDASLIFTASRQLSALPRDAAAARELWTRAMQENLARAQPLGGLPPHARAFAGDPDGTPAQKHAFQVSRLNFLALMFCLMVGTAGLPHLLTRYYTTPSVAETRTSVAWSLLFIALVYVAMPALAVLVKFEVLSKLVGHPFDTLPTWMAQWTRVDPALLSVSDVNGDHLLQFGELKLGADMVMLAMPELGGLPYVISGLVAAGGLAAALSTADGLLLTIGNALAHDTYVGRVKDHRGAMQRVMLSKFALLLVALAAAYVAAQKPADILYLVSASFSLAAAAFVPAMVLGIFWRRTTRQGAVAGMLSGLGLTMYYMAINLPAVRAALGLQGDGLWFSIQPISAGVFGVPVGAAVTWAVSLLARSAPHPSPAAT
ncbi:VC_2705 family sodium/solute symporter [Polaromonas sp. C04]|uniref:VC_2705 family sodium/solute symporter n=1 Tax=Polaromonas sp. C04 TaxID=1945857 RepID=UPI000987B7B9|nr:VC_2705 family sodium/solute symporter [Polaromonas sp. C04]OOG53060.1 cation acetate symporter [Polaromonas sp. C04]